MDTASLARQRYAAYMDDIQPGVRRYNVFWQPFESSGMLPSTQPLFCPAGYQLASPWEDLVPKHCYTGACICSFRIDLP